MWNRPKLVKFAEFNSHKSEFPEYNNIKAGRKYAEKHETKIENDIEAVKRTNSTTTMSGSKHACSKLIHHGCSFHWCWCIFTK